MIANADAARIPLPDKVVHCEVCSPPYYGPRKYKGEQERNWPAVSYAPMPGLPPVEVPAMRCELGREKTPGAYIAHLVLCFREARRVLRDDGVCWVVEGDSFASQGGVHKHGSYDDGTGRKFNGGRAESSSLSAGQLMGIPYRLLFALQADGWLVRNDVVWAKVAPMPESVSGTHWERHQVKVTGTRCKRGFPQEGADYVPHGDSITDRPMAEWRDCPGCPKCAATGGYMLRRGALRHTRSHETILQLTKSMLYYMDDARFKEDVSKVQKRIAANGLLYQQEDRTAPTPLQGMPETSQEGIFSQRAREGIRQAVLGDRRQREEGGVSAELPQDGTGQGSFQTVRSLREGQGEESEIPSIGKGQRDEASSPCPTNGESVLSGTNAGLLETSKPAEISQGPMDQVYQISEGARCQIEEGQEVQEVGEGPGSGEAVQYNSPSALKECALYLDAFAVESDQSDAELPLLLLRRDGENSDPGPHHTSESGRSAHEREYSGSLPEMQRKEGQQIAKRNPRDVLHVTVEEELYQQFLDWRASLEDGNPPDILTPSPEPFKGEHYAAFPSSLIRPLILSSAPLKCCPVCGAGWAAVVERETVREIAQKNGWKSPGLPPSYQAMKNDGTMQVDDISSGIYVAGNQQKSPNVSVLGYRPTCTCVKALAKEYTGAGSETTLDEWANRANEVANRLAPIPGLVLDIFTGSGTTGVACRELGLRFVGLDISGEYLRDIALARSERLTPSASLATLPMFAEAA